MDRALLQARWIAPRPGERRSGGGVLLVEGRVAAVLAGPAAVARAARAEGLRPLDLGDALLTAGLVNAHAHLELGALEGRVAPGADFAAWIAQVVALRATLEPAELEAAVRAGADRLLAGGTTAVGDIDSTGAAARALPAHPMRAVVYREVLDLDAPERRAATLAKVARPLPPAPRICEGLSPHAPYTVGDALLAAAAELARRRRLPVAMHWAETAEEHEWLARGSGPLARLLPASPRRATLDRLADAGWLDPGARGFPLTLVHGNRALPAERATVARAGAALVHCPGTHAFFDRAPFDLAAWRAAGVPLALGTDSLASNAGLDLRREMALLRSAHPELGPEEVLELATLGGARALGRGGALGELAPGACADLVAWRADGAADALAALEALTHGALTPDGVWIDGVRL